jgi:hypothetical protein
LQNEIDLKQMTKNTKKTYVRVKLNICYFEIKRRNVFGFNYAQQWKETHGQNARDRHWYAFGDPICR